MSKKTKNGQNAFFDKNLKIKFLPKKYLST